MGVADIYREGYKTIYWQGKIFTQITLALILPMCFFFLAQIVASEILYENSTIRKDKIMEGTDPTEPTLEYRLPNLSSSEFKTYLLFKAGSIIYLLIVSLLSTSASVYATACIYTNRKVTFKKAMNAYTKVWKKLLLTFFCTCAAYVAYNVLSLVGFISWEIFLNTSIQLRQAIGVVGMGALMVLYLVGLVYMGIVWQLADTVAILEDVGGFQAMNKSKELTQGKMLMAIPIFFNFNIMVLVVEFVFRKMVVHEMYTGKMERIGHGIICLMLLTMLSLFGRVCETVFYLACKSCHHESINMSTLSDDDLEFHLLLEDQQKDLETQTRVWVPKHLLVSWE